jgi:import receptor subunit TOM22
MSEHGSNGSSGSIEEIGPEEIEESINENPAVSITSEDRDESSLIPEAEDDPPLENLEMINVVEDPAPEPTLAPVAEPVSEPAPAPAADPVLLLDSTPVVESVSAAVVAPVSEAAPAAVVESAAAPEPALDAPVVEVSAPEPVAAAPERAADRPVVPIEVEEVPRAPLPPAPQPSQIVRSAPVVDDEEEDDDDIDETLAERLVGLSEMFPDGLRSGTVSLFKNSWSATQYLYSFSRSAGWIFFSTASILFMPVMIETERLTIMDQQKQQKTQMLLGPGVASSGAPSLGPPPI